jgi:hypothetical protein
MYLPACGSLLIIGIILNFLDIRMLALTLLVGASIFVPVPSDTGFHFYTFCIASEILVGVLAYATGKEAGFLIANCCFLLVIAHLMGYALDGSTPLSPYHVIVKLLETIELGICIALSPVLIPVLRNQDATE